MPILIGIISSVFATEVVSLDIVFLSLVLITINFLKYRVKLPIQLIIWPVTIFCTYLIINRYQTLFDIEAAINYLVLLQALKIAEAKGKRDLFIHAMIVFFIISGATLFSQTLFTTLIMFMLITANFINIYLIENNFDKTDSVILFLKRSIPYTILSTCLVTILFIVFPRYELGFINLKDQIASSGFSPEVSPSNVDEIVLSETKVFRAFLNESDNLATSQAYWIGAVLEYTDGFNWKIEPSSTLHSFSRQPKTKENLIEYRIQTESMMSHFLYTLDSPIEPPTLREDLNISQIAPKTFQLRRKNTKKVYYSGRSVLEELIQTQNDFNKLLHIPPTLLNVQFTTLIAGLKAENDQQTLANILGFFSNNNFSYTLKPGRSRSLHEFIFKNKKGFCIHFASAFAIMARAAGIPARVVTGFQGGEYNEFGHFFLVKELDAHAWVETYIKNYGWKRYDPVESVAPLRISLGSSSFFATLGQKGFNLNSQNLFYKQYRRFINAIDYINARFGQFIFSFDTTYQEKIAQKLSVNLTLIHQISFIVPIVFLLALFGFYTFRNWKYFQPKNEIILFFKLCLKLKKIGVIRQTGQSANSLLLLINQSKVLSKTQINLITKFLTIYQEYRFSKDGHPKQLQELKTLLKQIQLNNNKKDETTQC